MVTRIGVVTDVCDPLRVQHLPADSQDAFSDGSRHPGVKAVGDNVIEAPESAGSGITNVHRVQTDISQTQLRHGRLAGGKGTLGQIKPDEFAVRQMERHRNKVTAHAAPEFQDARTIDWRWLHS